MFAPRPAPPGAAEQMPNFYSQHQPPMLAEQPRHLQQQEDALTTAQQLQQARDYLATLQSDRAESCSDLEEEAKVFLGSQYTEEEERRFRLIYQLVRYQVSKTIGVESSKSVHVSSRVFQCNFLSWLAEGGCYNFVGCSGVIHNPRLSFPPHL